MTKYTHRLFGWAIAVLFTLSGYGARADDDWSTFRGDPRLTGSRDVAVCDSPRLLWTYDTGSEVESTAAIVDGVAYVGTMTGSMLALSIDADSKKGKQLWEYKTEDSIVRSSAGVRDGRVFFGDDFGIFHCVDARTGKKVWTYDTEGAEIVSSANFWGDAVLFGCYDSHLFCLDRKTGNVRWKILTGGPVHSTPAIVDGKTFVAGCDAMLRVIDLEKGAEVGQLALEDYSAASPAVDGSLLYLGTFAC